MRGVILEGGNAHSTGRSNKEKNKGFFKEDSGQNSPPRTSGSESNAANNTTTNKSTTSINNNVKEGNKEVNGVTPLELNSVCERLVSAALTRGSADNVSVVVVMFGQSTSQTSSQM